MGVGYCSSVVLLLFNSCILILQAASITHALSAQSFDTSALISASNMDEQDAGGFPEPRLSPLGFSIFIALDMAEQDVGKFPESLIPERLFDSGSPDMAEQDERVFPEPDISPGPSDKVEQDVEGFPEPRHSLGASDMAEQDVGVFPEPRLSPGASDMAEHDVQGFSESILPEWLFDSGSSDMAEQDERVFPEPDISPGASDMAEQDVGGFPTTGIEDKVGDSTHGAASSKGDKLMQVDSRLQIHFVAIRGGVHGHGYTLISHSEPFMSECKSGKVGEFKTVVLQETELNWEDGHPRGCKCVVSGNTMFLLGGLMHKLEPSRLEPIGSEDVYMIDIEGSATSRRWTRGPSMSVSRIFHAAVCVDEKIYVFGGHRVFPCFISSSNGEEKLEYTPWAEVYDTEEEKWSSIEFPLDLSSKCPPNPRCCVIEVGGNKKILMFCNENVFADDLNSGEWNDNFINKKKITKIVYASRFWKVLQSGDLLFFITTSGWWVLNLLSMQLLDGQVVGLFEIEKELPSFRASYVKVGHWPDEVISLGCSAGIHYFIIFYPVCNDDGRYIYVVSVTVTEDLTKNSRVASLISFGRFLLKGIVCEHFYAVQ